MYTHGMDKNIYDLQQTISKATAEKLLKQNGLSVHDLAEYIGIKPRSLRSTWRNGRLDTRQTLALIGYLALNDSQHKAMHRHRENPALIALLAELDRQSDRQSDKPDPER